MKDVLIPRIESLLQETRRTRRAAVAGVILAAIVALLAWGQVAGWGPAAVFAQNTVATGTVTVTSDVDGRFEVHNTLTAKVSNVMDAQDVKNASYTYTWFHLPGSAIDCTEVHERDRIKWRGVNGNELILGFAQAGRKICARVEFKDDKMYDEVLYSDPTEKIRRGPVIEVKLDSGEFDVDGDAQVGKTVRANTDFVDYPDFVAGGRLEGADYTYQWIYWDPVDLGLDGDEGDISDATGQTYVVQGTDGGKYLQVELTFACDTSFDACTSGTRMTFANFVSGYIRPAPTLTLTSRAPSGEPEVNFELTAEPEVFGVTSPTYAFEWYAVPAGVPLSETAHRISGASRATYTPVNEDVGKKIVAKVSLRDDQSNLVSGTSALDLDTTLIVPIPLPVRSSAEIEVIVAPSDDFYIDETLQANTTVMNLLGLPAASTFTYQWIYVRADGTFETAISGATSQMYGPLTADDEGKYLQVQITFTPTEPPGALERMVLANMQTPAIRARPPAESAYDLRAQVPPNGGFVRLTWKITSEGVGAPLKFEYRYKPMMAIDYTGTLAQDWKDVPGDVSTRSLTITSDLINAADYTFELRSVGQLGFATPEVSDTATYRHKTRGCPET